MKSDNYSYKVRLNVRFGFGICRNIGEYLKKSGLNNVGFIIDRGVFSSEPVKAMIKSAQDHCSVNKVYECSLVEPTYDELDAITEEFRNQKFDVIIGVGGGSIMDTAKGVCALITNPGKGIQYRGFDLLKNNPIHMIAVPTTAGTGSEVTPNAVFTDSNEQRKLGINGDKMFAYMSFLDPELTMTCPKRPTVSSGMDAIVHTLESFGSIAATPFSRMYSREAFRLLFNSLPKLVDNMNDKDLRSKMLLGSHYAGIALFNASAGPSGALSYPLGVLFKVPHGIAGAVFLPKVLRKNVEMGYYGYSELYDLIDGANMSLSEKEKAFAFCDALDTLCNKVEIPDKLTVFGVTENDIDILHKQTVTGLKAAIDHNPVKFEDKHIREILENMI
ncbi:MAG: iron-containing alcohol dehydrogenase [Candidatus Aenigmarchaeota archaeon]|nr:iron-containing alcohol dehydrogenase [Candidatus Aenigmarchaeota archaeon]